MGFPTTGVLDNFNRADENPLANGTWSGPVFTTHTQDRLITNQGASNAGASDSYWSTVTFGPDSEVFLTIAVLPSLAQGNGSAVYYRLLTPNTGTVSGYALDVSMDVSPFPLNQYRYRRIDNAVHTQLGAITVGPSLAAGDRFGANVVGSTLTEFTKQGAGAWTAVDGGRTDATYRGAGNIGIRVDGDATNPSTQRIDDFGGGTVVVSGMLYLVGR